MNKIVQELEKKGCDIKGTMDRMLNDEEFYVSLLSEAINDAGFSELGAALSRGDVEGAFEYAYKLKGVLGNMGFTSLYLMTCKMVESLRKGVIEGVGDIYTGFIIERETYVELICS